MATAIWAEFGTAEEMVAALEALRAQGHLVLEAFSPFRVHRAMPLVRTGRSWLPLIALAAGAFGGVAGYLVQWFTNAWAYPQNAGGRPANAVPAFMFNTFESLVLATSCVVFLAFLVLLRLPRLWDPRQAIAGFGRVTEDRFGVLVRDPEPFLVPEVTVPLLEQAGALRVERVELPE